MRKVRMVCPHDGEDGYCEVCKRTVPHHFELLASPDRPPKCPTHKVRLVVA